MPINADTLNKLYGFNLSCHEVEGFLASVAEPCDQVKTSEDVVVSRIGRELDHSKTSVVFEYPRSEGDPYYPIPQLKNSELYHKYKSLAEQLTGVHFVGRLGTYKYYNMDQIVAQALSIFERISKTSEAKSIAARTLSMGIFELDSKFGPPDPANCEAA
jgi:UDP-galactopyranose mutase